MDVFGGGAAYCPWQYGGRTAAIAYAAAPSLLLRNTLGVNLCPEEPRRGSILNTYGVHVLVIRVIPRRCRGLLILNAYGVLRMDE